MAEEPRDTGRRGDHARSPSRSASISLRGLRADRSRRTGHFMRDPTVVHGTDVRELRIYQTALRLLLHDTRAPIRRILSALGTLSVEMTPGTEAWRLLAGMTQDVEQLDEVLNAVGELERLPKRAAELEPVPTDLLDFVYGTLSGLNHSSHDVHVDVARCSVRIDAALVGRALVNLIANALTHTPIGSSVWIRARAEADQVEFLVEDDGPGIEPGLRERIFDPFERGAAPDSAAGLGLGLALVRGIAELLGGSVSADERVGGGASLRLLIPTTDE